MSWKETLYRMRKLSCKRVHEGNQRCFSPIDDASESEVDLVLQGLEWADGHPRDGELYNAVFVEDSNDWETGLLDEWHWRMEPFKEPQRKEPRIYCKFCGAKLRRDHIGQKCPTDNCQWEHGVSDD